MPAPQKAPHRMPIISVRAPRVAATERVRHCSTFGAAKGFGKPSVDSDSGKTGFGEEPKSSNGANV